MCICLYFFLYFFVFRKNIHVYFSLSYSIVSALRPEVDVGTSLPMSTVSNN